MFVPFGSRSLTTLLGAIYLLSLLRSRPSHRSNFLDSLPRFSPVGHFPLFIFPPCHHLVSPLASSSTRASPYRLALVFSSENGYTSRCVYDRHSENCEKRSLRCGRATTASNVPREPQSTSSSRSQSLSFILVVLVTVVVLSFALLYRCAELIVSLCTFRRCL